MIGLEGQDADKILDNFISWRLKDTTGYSADMLELDVFTQDIDLSIEKSQHYKFSIDGVERGHFYITSAQLSFNERLSLCLTSFDYAAEQHSNAMESLLTSGSKSYSQKTVQQIVNDIATKHKFSTKIEQSIAMQMIEHIDRTDEKALSFLNRLAEMFDGYLKVQESTLYIHQRGAKQSLSHQSLEPKNIDTHHIKQGSIQLIGDQRFQGVIAKYYDQQGQVAKTNVGKAPFKMLEGIQPSQQQADYAAQAGLKRFEREAKKLSLECEAIPDLFAESLIRIQDINSQIDGVYSIDVVTHAPYSTKIQATLSQEDP